MKYLNLGCGGNRPQDEQWTNLDHLRVFLKPGTPERRQLDSEPRYVDHALPERMPFPDEHFDAILCSHVVEHFDCHEAVKLLADCYRVLVKGGGLVVSVPNAEYFLSVHHLDTPARAMELFGEPIHDEWQPNFFSYALFHREHKQVLTYDSLKCLLLQAGFPAAYRSPCTPGSVVVMDHLNRCKFSAVLYAIKAVE